MKKKSLFDVMFPDIVEAREKLEKELGDRWAKYDGSGLLGEYIAVQVTDTIIQGEAKS